MSATSIKGKKIFTIGGLIIIVALISIVAVFILLSKLKAEKLYSVVYLATGEVYIGKLTTFPRMALDDAYLLQIVKDKEDASKSSFQLTPIKESVWSPKKLYLNEKNVVYYGQIEETSKAAEAIRNEGR